MQDPDKEKCHVCHKLLKKTSMKKHLANVHSKAAQDKKLVKADREVAKKQALKAAVAEIMVNPNYAVSSDVDDKKLMQLQQQLEDFHFMEISPEQTKKSLAKTESMVKKRQQPELAIQKRLEKQYGAGHKVVPIGVIDVLTKDELIEIKNWDDWMKGFAQCILYGRYYPNHMKHLRFFGEPPSVEKELIIRTICAEYGIKITQEPWP